MSHQDKHTEEPTSTKNGHHGAASTASQDKKRVTAEDVMKEVETTATKAAEGAREQIKTAQDRAKEALGAAEKEVVMMIDDAKERLAPIDSWIRTTTREHPYMVVSTAVGVSFLAGFLMRRRAAVGAGAAVGFIAGCLLQGSGSMAARHRKAKD